MFEQQKRHIIREPEDFKPGLKGELVFVGSALKWVKGLLAMRPPYRRDSLNFDKETGLPTIHFKQKNK